MRPLKRGNSDPTVVFRSAAMESVVALAGRVARTDASVLLLGESGTGKGLLAEAIHRWSARRDRPFVTVPCANIPAELFESELFGHERGAHTDAHARRTGRFEAADGGTLLLDGVESLTPPLQAKLLRVLQERAFERLGGSDTVTIDVRILSSSRTDLAALVSAGAFREDLFYRLNVVQIRIPPLRERPDDILPLARQFLKELRGWRPGRGQVRLSADARRAMVGHLWPGNAREVRNAIEAALIASDGPEIGASDLPMTRLAGIEGMVAGAATRALTLDQLEEMYIREVLRLTRGNQTRAAAILGISRKTLLFKRKRMEGKER